MFLANVLKIFVRYNEQKIGGKHMKANQEIRDQIFFNRLKNWEVAQAVGISDSRLSVWLRTELSDERKERVLKAIDSLTKQPQ